MTDWLCTIAQAEAEIKITGPRPGETTVTTVDTSWLMSNIPLVSARINNMTRMRFVPWKEQYLYDAFGPHIDDVYRKLDLGRPILHPTEVINALGQTLTLGTDYMVKPQDSPGFQLQLINSGYGWYGWSYGIGYGWAFWIAPLQYLNAIKVTGIWGYRQYYPDEGWTDSLVTLAENINTTQKTFTVSGVNGANAQGYIPALSVGNTLQIDDEWMQVTAINSTDNTLTVIRHFNGSDAAAHTTDTAIYTWSVQPEIVRAATRWLAYWYSRRGAFEAVKTDLSAGRTMVYPEDAPAEVMHIIEQTRDWRWGIV